MPFFGDTGASSNVDKVSAEEWINIQALNAAIAFVQTGEACNSEDDWAIKDVIGVAQDFRAFIYGMRGSE
jgi:hypothetical protein